MANLKSVQANRVISIVALVLVSVSFFACSLLGAGVSFVEPELRLVDIKIKEAKLLQTVLEFEVQLDNDNQEAIFVSGGSQKIYLNDQYVGKGYLSDSVTVPAFSNSRASVEVFVDNLTLLAKLIPILERDSLHYRLDSSLVVGKGFASRRYTVTKEDTFRFTTPLDLSPLRPMN